jgi:hypothetical protein
MTVWTAKPGCFRVFLAPFSRERPVGKKVSDSELKPGNRIKVARSSNDFDVKFLGQEGVVVKNVGFGFFRVKLDQGDESPKLPAAILDKA